MTPLDLTRTHIHLAVDGAAEHLDAASLWAGDPADLEARLPNWLLASFPIAVDAEPGAAEMHPNGDELLVVASGALEVHLDGAEPVQAATGETVVVPRGSWHRLRGRASGTLVTVTFGRGTRRR